MSLKPGTGIPVPRTVHKLLFLLEMQHRDGVHAFKMTNKIARKEGHRQVHITPRGGTSILGGRGAWPQNLPLKFLLEPQILPP